MFSEKQLKGLVGLLVIVGLCVCGGRVVRGDDAATQSPPAAVPQSPASTEGGAAPAPTAGEATPQGASPAAPPTKPTIRITLQEAVLMAVDHNPDLSLERLKPPIQATGEDQERAVFDPILRADFSQLWNMGQKTWDINSVLGPFDTRTTSSDVSVQEFLPTGTKLTLSANSSTQQAQFPHSKISTVAFTSVRTGLTATQSLLRGMGLGPNLARLREARLETLGSDYVFRGISETFVSQVEETYWDYALTSRQVEIVVESLKIAEQQLADTRERVSVGRLPETEVAAAQAEVALRREDLINARSNFAKIRLRLLRLLSPEEPNVWASEVTLLNQPAPTGEGLGDVEDHVKVALRWRPELNQARLAVKRGDLEIVRTKNGLLPKMDVFIDMGMSGYAASFSRAARDYSKKDNSYDVTTGLSFEFPVINRDARAQYRRAMLSRVQAEKAVENLEQLVQVDVRSAYVEVSRAEEQIAATAATRQFKGEALRAETEKFRVGRSTSFLVAQAQRDYLASQIGEVEAVVTHLKALAELYRLEGSLLVRRGILAPGAEPVDSF